MKRPPPLYPVAIAVAYVLAVFADGAFPPADLIRPLLIAVALTLIVQVVATLLLRDRDAGALVAGVVIAALPALPFVVVALAVFLAFLTIPGLVARARSGVAKPAPWRSATSLLNLVAVIAVVISAGQLLIDGRFAPAPGIAQPLASTDANAPDIYVILLDGHPRWDTLASEFDYDSEPFLSAMEGRGFEVARDSRSNYNTTDLTFASMFQMRQLQDVPAFTAGVAADKDQKSNSLLLSNLVDQGSAFDELHRHGYEVIGLPSEFTWLGIPADRSLGSNQMDDLEIQLLTASRLRTVAPDLVRNVAAGQHRDRILDSFQRLTALATEQAAHPRFVFAHIISPHSPPVLGPENAPRDAWPCFPATCSFWVTGEPSGHEAEVAVMRDEVAAVDARTLETVRSIVADSERPAVIVVMSDHGGRNDLSDRAEMLRSFFVARTPGHPGLFPSDMSPVNLIPRLLNAYVGANLPMAPEESYWTDLEGTVAHGFSGFVRIDPDVPPD